MKLSYNSFNTILYKNEDKQLFIENKLKTKLNKILISSFSIEHLKNQQEI